MSHAAQHEPGARLARKAVHDDRLACFDARRHRGHHVVEHFVQGDVVVRVGRVDEVEAAPMRLLRPIPDTAERDHVCTRHDLVRARRTVQIGDPQPAWIDEMRAARRPCRLLDVVLRCEVGEPYRQGAEADDVVVAVGVPAHRPVQWRGPSRGDRADAPARAREPRRRSTQRRAVSPPASIVRTSAWENESTPSRPATSSRPPSASSIARCNATHASIASSS